MDRGRTTDEPAMRVRQIGWWALAAAAAVHGILLLGMRVPREGQIVGLARRTLIWETQPRRLQTSAAQGARIAGIHRGICREIPQAGTFSKHVLLLAQRVPAMAVVASILCVQGVRGGGAPHEPGMREGNALMWRIEAEGELAGAVMRAWQHGGALHVQTNYAPRAPVVLEVSAREGVLPAIVRVVHSSGDTAFDDCARTILRSLRLVVPRRGRPHGGGDGDWPRGRVVVTVEPED